MQVLLGMLLCALLLTFRSGVHLSAAGTNDNDWANLFDFDKFDARHLVGAGGAAMDQPGSSVYRTGDTCPDDYVSQHEFEHGNVNLINSEIPPTNQPASIHHVKPSQATSSHGLSGNYNPKQCQYCQRTFTRANVRGQHEMNRCILRGLPGAIAIRSADGSPAVQCRTCGQEFKKQNLFRLHQDANGHCRLREQPGVGDDSLPQCPICFATSFDTFGFVLHAHTCLARVQIPGAELLQTRETFVLRCQSCKKPFLTEDGFQDHLNRCRWRTRAQRP
ncbi:Secreted protein [Plasmodiophora brassicae]